MQTVESYQILMHHAKEKLQQEDSLDIHFGRLTNWESPYLNFSAFESLKTKGLDLISNLKLKKEIINIYERNFNSLINDYDRSEWEFVTGVVTAALTSNPAGYVTTIFPRFGISTVEVNEIVFTADAPADRESG